MNRRSNKTYRIVCCSAIVLPLALIWRNLSAQSASTVETVANLRARTSSPTSVNLQGYYAAGDNGGGAFVYDPSDTSAPDNGGTIIVDAAGHRYHRQVSGCLSVKYFGAKMDGTTNDSVPFQNTIDAAVATGYGCVFIPNGSAIVSTLSISNNNLTINCGNSSLNGTGGSKLIAASTSTIILRIGTVSGITIIGCSFISPSQQRSGALISADGTVDLTFERLYVSGAWDAISFKNVTQSYVRGASIRDWNHDAISIDGGGDNYFAHLVIDEDNANYTPNAGFHVLANGGSITVSDSDILHGHNGFWINPGKGQFVDWVYMSNVYLDSCDYNVNKGGVGLKITPIGGGIAYGGSFSNLWASTCNIGVQIAGERDSPTSDYQFSSPRILHNYQNGVSISEANNIHFMNSVISGNSQASFGSYDGVEIAVGATGVSFMGGHIGGGVENFGNTQRHNISLDRDLTGRVTVMGVDLSTSTSSDVFDGASQTAQIHIRESPGYNPVGISRMTMALPLSYTAGRTEEHVSVLDGSVDSILVEGITVCTRVPCSLTLSAEQSLRINGSGLVNVVLNKD